MTGQMYLLKIQSAVRRIQHFVDTFLTGGRWPDFPQLAMAAPGSPSFVPPQATDGSSFLDSLKDGFVWGVPKTRKSLERRMRKQWGTSYMAPFQRRHDLIVCLHCGHYHEAHSICGHCYEIVKKETQLIYKTMNIKDRVPEQKEVVILYEGEIADPVTTQDKKVVEMPKKRPLWFNSNLLTKVSPTENE